MAKDTELVKDDPVGLTLFERMATDPNASVEKIERLMALWERSEARKSEAAFNAAMSEAQKAMRTVGHDSDNPQTHSRYASYEALDQAIRPIYTAHGFALSFDTGEAVRELEVRVLCYVTHVGGHARTYHLDMPADGKGARGGDVMTRTHATSSALSYGQRYLLKMIFNVSTGESDDDGNRAGRVEPPHTDAPKGFDDWLADMEALADNGTKPLFEAWNKSAKPFQKHLGMKRWEELKKRAAKAGTK